MFTRIAVCAAFIVFATVPSAHAQQQPSPVQPAPVKRTILQRTDVPGTNLEVILASVEIAPGFKAGRHTHPGVVIGQVVEGDFWLQLDGQPEQVLHAGESATLPDRAIHNEGATVEKPVKLNVVYVVEKGQPLWCAELRRSNGREEVSAERQAFPKAQRRALRPSSASRRWL